MAWLDSYTTTRILFVYYTVAFSNEHPTLSTSILKTPSFEAAICVLDKLTLSYKIKTFTHIVHFDMQTTTALVSRIQPLKTPTTYST